MSSNFDLNCLIWGQYCSQSFQINIESTASVDSLVNTIKKRMYYQDDSGIRFVDIAFPKEGDDIEVFRDFERAIWEARNHQLQRVPQKLSEVFRHKPIDKNLHVVVDIPQFAIPPLELACVVHSETNGLLEPFVIKVGRRESVHTLKNFIREEAILRDYVLNWDFKIWRISIPIYDSFEERVKDMDFHQPLLASDPLSVCFPVEPSVLHLNIIAKGAKAGIEEKRDTLSALKERFSAALAIVSKPITSAGSAKLSGYIKSQFQYCICNGRYGAKTVAPPVQLFHPVFAHFLNDIKANGEIPQDITAKVTTYMKEATAVYSKEDHRRNHMGPMLGALLDVDIQLITDDNKRSSDGVVELNTTSGNFAVLLVKEDKNMFGGGHSDPSTQVGLSMARSWIQAKFESIRNRTCCPTFLIANAGPWIAVLGAVFTDMVIIQRLTDFIWVGLDSALNDEHCERVVRMFYSLREGLARLKRYYNELEPVVNPPLMDSRFFPAIRAYRDDEGKIVTFEYKGFLENDTCCVTLLAERQKETVTKGSKKQKVQEIEKIVVKFVERYGKESHELLAKAQRAPKLYYCGKLGVSPQDPNYGNIQMIVMEYIDGMTVSEAVTTFGLDHVKAGLEESIRLLHEDNRVFGDLRLPNIIVTNTGRVKLIDFDWAGDHGTTRYPKLMSEMIQWPQGVGPAAVMKKEHDMEMMKKLVG